MKSAVVPLLVVAGILVGLSSCMHLAPANYTDPEALRELLSTQTQPYYLIDVRTFDEYVSGHIPSAVNIPYDVLADHLPTTDKSALIIVYCQSGGRAAKAAATLKELGYTRVVNFGSITRWKGSYIQSTSPGECPCKSIQ